MDCLNNGETHVKSLTDVCQNVCAFIKTMTVDNLSKDEKINSFKIKNGNLQCLYSDLKTNLKQINELIKTLATMLDFTINQNDSTVDILTQWISSLSKKNDGCSKKRKLCPLYSPLKLSLKEKTKVSEDSKNKSKYTNSEKENKTSQNEVKSIWRLPIKRDGNPSDLLKKSKQTILLLQPQKEKVKIDITTLKSPKPSNSVNPSIAEVLSMEKTPVRTDEPKNVCENSLNQGTHLNDSIDSPNISLSHFNKIIKPVRNVFPIEKINCLQPNKNSTSSYQREMRNQSNDETTCSPTNSLENIHEDAISSKKSNQVLNGNVLDSFDLIPGLNDNQNDLPNYKFKEDPVRKRNERKLLNGWDCEDCCKFYEVNNDNPIEAKTAMNHFSRHRSVKHQHHAPTPPGFWDPV